MVFSDYLNNISNVGITKDPAEDAPEESRELTIKPADAAHDAADKLAAHTLPEIPEPGKGEVNNASSWDEFPNGRFGDSKSPAFGLHSDPWNSGIPNSLGVSVSFSFMTSVKP